jgi:uncharacterized protein (DUF362 family)/Pyruvate/2-oxoacid:ferredoxin oxidoreductase delta subunit
MSRVIVRRASYHYETLKEKVSEMLDALGGERITGQTRVLLKPNLLSAAPPEAGVVTHPLLVRAAAEYVLKRGALPVISDSPATGSFEKILVESGLKDNLSNLNVEIKAFKKSIPVDVGEPFGKIDIAEDALTTDFIINLPKLKTHSQMLLTLGVKNTFGCVVGYRKAEWHLRAGVNRELFAKLLVRICQTVKPTISILDGILAMEGQGPGKAGTPRPLGYLMASDNAFALDRAVCVVLGIDPDKLLTNKIAWETGLFRDKIDIEGTFEMAENFTFPDVTDLFFGQKPLQTFIRRYFIERPVAADDICSLCGECWKFCPALAISRQGRILRFDYDRCIRCYCCIEICPEGAIHTKEPLPARVLKRFVHP